VRTRQQARAGARIVSWFEDAAIFLEEDELRNRCGGD